VYVGAYDHHLYALNSSGVQQWKIETSGPVTSPSVGPDGTVYFGADRVYAVDGTTGKIKWSFADGYVGNASPLLDTQNGTLYVGAFDGTIYALRMQTGHERWQLATGTTIVSPPALGTNGLLYVGANRLYALSARDGRVHWSVGNSGNQWATPVVGADGTVYAGCSNQLVYAVSPRDGHVRWTFPISDGLIPSPALGPDGGIYVTQAGSGTLYALDGRSGQTQWLGMALAATGK
jgi:outer membrane protein assembly factor BamB